MPWKTPKPVKLTNLMVLVKPPFKPDPIPAYKIPKLSNIAQHVATDGLKDESARSYGR